MNNKIKLINCLFVSGVSGLMAINHYNVLASNQSLEVIWNKEVTGKGCESFNAITQTKDGGFVAVGQADTRLEDSISRGDAIIVKYNSNGEKEWQTTLEGDDTDLFYNVVESNDGNLYAIGKTFSTDIITNPNAYSNAIIVKYSPTGAMLDIKYIHDSGKQINYNSIIEIENNKLAIVGDKVYNGIRKSFIDIIDSTGDVKSTSVIEDFNSQIKIKDIIKTSKNKLVIIGSSTENSVSVPYIASFNLEGVKEWSFVPKSISTNLVTDIEGEFLSVIEDNKGNLVVGGYSSFEGNKGLIMGFDENGSLIKNSVVENNNIESYKSVFVTSKNEIVGIGNAKLSENQNILEDSNVVIDLYFSDSFDKDVSVSMNPSIKNKLINDAILTSDNELVMIGESYVKVESAQAKCEVNTFPISDDCIQSDASILKVKFKDIETCTITEKPIINADNKIVNKGDNFDTKKDITAVDKENNDLTQRIEVITNTVDTSKEGEYVVKYRVEDKCGNVTEKEIKVTVVEKKVESATDENKNENKDENKTQSTEKPQTSDNILVYAGLSMISSLGLYKSNRRNKK